MSITRHAGKAPPQPPRVEGLQDGDVTFREHLRDNSTLVASVVLCTGGLGALLCYALLPGRGGTGAASIAVGALLVLGVSAATVCGTYACYRRAAAGRNRLYVYGVARKATVTHVGLDVQRRHGMTRYAYVVWWKFTDPAGAKEYAGVTPLERMLAAEVGDELWVLVDAQNHRVAQRWAVFQQEGVFGGVEHFDQVRYSKIRPRDPRIMGGIATYV